MGYKEDGYSYQKDTTFKNIIDNLPDDYFENVDQQDL